MQRVRKTLPYADRLAQAVRVKVPPSGSAGRPMRTLVVDDVADLRSLWVGAFSGNGFEVVGEAADGLEGCRLAEILQPDLVLLDLAMPVLSGLEALPRLRAACPEARIVVLSGPPDRAMARRVRRAGADDYLEKGVSVAQLRARVLALLDPGPPVGPAAPEPRSVETLAEELRRPVRRMLGVVSTLRSLERPGGAELRARLLDDLAQQATVLDALTTDLLATHRRQSPGPATAGDADGA